MCKSNEFFSENGHLLFEDCFNSLTTTSAVKTKNFHFLCKGDLDEDSQIVLSNCLTFCANVLKNNVNEDEFILILEELSGVKKETKEGMLEKYQELIVRAKCMNEFSEETEEALSYDSFKKFPLKAELNEELLGSLNGRLVDVSWRLIYSLQSKNINKLYQPLYLLTLKVTKSKLHEGKTR